MAGHTRPRGEAGETVNEDARRSLKEDIDRIVAEGAARMARHLPMTTEELYDENGL